MAMEGYKEERKAVLEMRRQLNAYFRGFPGASAVRQKLMKLEHFAEIESFLNSIKTQY
jgi:tRNA-dihydrouridine synthase